MSKDPLNSSARCDSLNLLYPPFRERLERGLELARAAGFQVYPFETYRSWERQAHLYSSGRTAPGRIVTRARPGYSFHQYGLAVDLVFDGSPAPDVQWDWIGDYVGEKAGDYDRLGPIVMQSGIDWYGVVGAPFHEKPHFQWPTNATAYQMLQIYENAGLPGVWRELDRLTKTK